MLPTFGWLATFAVGFVLGLLGGGGSILIVPVLVYLFLNPAEQATGLSLLVVGLAAAIGLFVSKDYKSVQTRTALMFAIPSSIGAFLSRKFFVPLTPAQIGPFTKDAFLLVLFAALMLIVSYRMIAPVNAPKDQAINELEPGNADHPSPLGEGQGWGKGMILKTTLLGFTVGIVAGYLGAGGGFLIVPVLNQVLGLTMALAIPTSLAIIAAQSLIGFTGALGTTVLDWPFALGLTSVAIVGFLAGVRVKSRIDPAKLKPAFGYFVLSTGLFMLIQELLLKKS